MPSLSLEERLARHEAFWRRERSDEPLLGVAVNITFPLVCFTDRPLPIEEGQVSPEMIDSRQFLTDWDRTFMRAEARGETLFIVASAFDGILWIEAIAGCEVYCSMSGSSVWAEHPDPSWEQLAELTFDVDNPWLAKLLEYTATLREHAAGGYPVGAPLLRGVADMVEALLGSQRMVLEYYDHPEEMHRLLDICSEIWRQLTMRLVPVLGQFHGGMAAGRRRVWGPGTCILYQDDAVALLSPTIYRAFILPREDAIFRQWDRTMMHVHSGTLPIVIEDLLQLESLTALEVLLDPAGPTLPHLLPLFQRVQSAKALLVCGEMDLEDVELLLEHLSPAGLALLIKVKTEEEADALFPQVVALLNRRDKARHI